VLVGSFGYVSYDLSVDITEVVVTATADWEDEAGNVDCEVGQVGGRLQCESDERTEARETGVLRPANLCNKLLFLVTLHEQCCTNITILYKYWPWMDWVLACNELQAMHKLVYYLLQVFSTWYSVHVRLIIVF